MKVAVGLTPGEQVSAPLGIVIDVLRATSTICQALAGGYERVICVGEIEDARALAGPGVALAGERHNVKIEGFDYGNSPREFAGEAHEAKTLVLTTTNGTKALLAAAERCETVLVASLLNLGAVAAAALRVPTRSRSSAPASRAGSRSTTRTWPAGSPPSSAGRPTTPR